MPEGRRYAIVVAQLIVDWSATATDVEVAVADALIGMDVLESGKVQIKVELHGMVKMDENGYALPWVDSLPRA